MGNDVRRFGQVELGRTPGRLTVAGKPVEIDRAGFAILSLLAREAGEEVGKERLLEAGWPDRVVDENSLAKAISRLRHALGDDGSAVETVHGYGYRLAADVRIDTAVTSPPARAPPATFRRRAVLLAGALGLIAVAGAAMLSGGAHADGESRVINGEPPDAIGRVLWVDDNPQNNVAETRYLEARKIAVYQVDTTRDALALLPMYEYGAVISDMGRGERPLAGIDLLKAMRARGDPRPFFLYTVHSSEAQRQLVAEAGGQGVAETREELYAAVLPLFGPAEK